MNKNHLVLGWLSAGILGLAVSSAHAQTSTITRVSSFEYDAAGMLVKEVIEPDSPDQCLQTTHSYSPQGNPASSSSSACAEANGYAIASASDPRSSVKAYAAQTATIEGVSYISAAGIFATSITNVLGQSESYEYDPRHGQITKLTGPNGGVTTWVYDGFGRKTRESRADGTYTLWDHKLCQVAGQALDPVCANPVSNGGFTHAAEWYVREVSYGNNGVELTAAKYLIHDTLGRVVRTRNDSFMSESIAANRYASIQDTVYNGLGQAAYQSIAYLTQGGSPQWSSYEYDELGRVVKETTPDGNGGSAILQTAYNGLETVITNALGQDKKSYKNATGQTERIEDAAGASVLYTYDALGQLTQTNAAGSTTKLTYDVRGRKTSMQDPAMGRWDYTYNVFGELVWQQDSLSQAVTMAYDRLGRMTRRTEPDLISNWYYDQKANGSSCGAGIGKLCAATANNGYRRVHTYDAMGRPTSTATVLDNAAQLAVSTQVYDSVTGRLRAQTWPSGYKALYVYTAAGANWSAGHLWKVRGMDGATQNALWQAKDKDPQGRLIRYQGGNGVVTERNVEAVTGKVNGIQATLNGQVQGDVLNHNYAYDKLGNLLTRSDVNTGVAESFSYDTLNRLSLYSTLGGNLAIQQQVQVLYDARGNIKYKSDVGYYNYDSQRPNRLTAITTTAQNWSGATGYVTVTNIGSKALEYAFDDYLPGVRNIDLGEGNVALGNGNLMYTVSQDSASGTHTVRWEEYTSFNKIREMRFGNLTSPSDPTNAVADRTIAFVYGPEHQRLRQTITLSSNAPSHMEAGTTWYMNGPDSLGLSYEKEIKANGLIEHKHYLTAGGESFALHTQREGELNGKPDRQVSYFHHDHLGSLSVISNEAGAVIERLAYDPWGKRRYSDGNRDPNDTLTSAVTDRGYTMHEHMDEMGVINMNGRVQDPAVGRFLSADPYIQSPGDLQSYDRYAYVLNNPLAYTDPTGYWSFSRFVSSVFKATHVPTMKNIFKAVAAQPGQKQIDKKVMSSKKTYAAGKIAVTVVASFWGAGEYAAAAWDAYYSYQATGSANAAFKAGATTYATAVAFNVAGDVGVAYGEVARIAAHAVVGCAASKAQGGSCSSGAAGAAVGVGTGMALGHNWATAVIGGGLGSVAAGGKFEDGAVMGAMGHAFNHLLHVGISGKLPIIGGGSANIGISFPFRDGAKFDAGLFFEGDIVGGPSLGKLYGGVTKVIGYQRGDFDSARGSYDLQYSAGAGPFGGDMSFNARTNEFSGGALRLGPQLGLSVSGSTSNTMSIRQTYREIISPVVNYVKDRLAK